MATTKKAADVEAVTNETVQKDEQRVRIMIPYVEGESEYEVVGINGVLHQIQKGEEVEVTRAVAQVLSNSNKQIKQAQENRRRFKKQVTDL